MLHRSLFVSATALKQVRGKTAFSALAIPQPPIEAEVLLFSHKICPYCCKTVALLRHLGVPFSEQEVSPLTKNQIKWSAEYKKVPIAVFADGKVYNDSAVIADELMKRFPLADDGKSFSSASALEWAEWSTATLAVMM
jgi:glutathione S-transferase